MTNEAPRPLDTFLSQEDLLKRPLKTTTAIDPANPLEIDDGIHVEPISKDCSEFRVEIHVADAGLLQGHTAIIDAARQQGWTEYHPTRPEKSRPLLPPAVFSSALGLDASSQDGVPAIELGFDFDMKSRAIGNVMLQKVRVQTEQFTYAEHTELLDKRRSGHPRYTEARNRLGIARRLHAPEGMVNRIAGERRSEDTVQFFMVAANRLIARVAANDLSATGIPRGGWPWLFRNHSDEAYMSWRDEREREVLAKVRPGSYGKKPIGHTGLGIDMYCHFTSPLRRFPDLANHLNLHAVMAGQEPPYKEQEIEEIGREMMALYIARRPQHFREAA